MKIRPEDEAPDSPLGPPPTPFSPSGRQSVFYSKLTTHEHQRLREFRALLNKSAREDPTLLSTPALKRFANDATLCRYLRARDWNLKRAMKMLKCVPGRTPLAPDENPNSTTGTTEKPKKSQTRRSPRVPDPSIHPSIQGLAAVAQGGPPRVHHLGRRQEGGRGGQAVPLRPRQARPRGAHRSAGSRRRQRAGFARALPHLHPGARHVERHRGG